MIESLDAQTVSDGDRGFIGMASRVNPLNLQPGMVQLAQNMRLDRGVASVRQGARRVAEGISISKAPIVLPFTLGTDQEGRVLISNKVFVSDHGFSNGDIVRVWSESSRYSGHHVISVVDRHSITFPIVGGGPKSRKLQLNKGPVLQEIYSGGILVSGVFSSPHLNDNSEYLVVCGPSQVYLWRDGAGLIIKFLPEGEIIDQFDTVSIVQAFDRLYILRSALFAGVYAPRDATELKREGATVTVTCSNHGYKRGQRIKIENADASDYNVEADITEVTRDTFSFIISTAAAKTPDSIKRIVCRIVKPPLYWDGIAEGFIRAVGGSHPTGPTYSRMPSSGIGIYFGNQIWVKSGRDQVQISDVLDPDTYDPFFKSFRTNAGSNDEIVALHPYADGHVVVFGSKSIYLATVALAADGVHIDPARSAIVLLTTEVGCAARNTVVTAGDSIFWLSPNHGVYRLDSKLDLKLRGNTQPLSDSVADIFATINGAAIGTSCAIYFNNRYWIAIPTGSASLPNTLLIYNMLNQAWESQDVYTFAISNLVVSDFQGVRSLFAISPLGNVYVLNSREGGDSQFSGEKVDTISGRLLTRRYSLGTFYSKRFRRMQASIFLRKDEAIKIIGSFTDPDSTPLIATIKNSGKDSVFSVRQNIGRRATSLDLDFRTHSGRPEIRACQVEGIVSLPAGQRTIH